MKLPNTYKSLWKMFNNAGSLPWVLNFKIMHLGESVSQTTVQQMDHSFIKFQPSTSGPLGAVFRTLRLLTNYRFSLRKHGAGNPLSLALEDLATLSSTDSASRIVTTRGTKLSISPSQQG